MKFRICLVFYFLPIILTYGQVDIELKYKEMQNAFILGLEEEGLKIGHQIISLPEYESHRQKTLVKLSELFLTRALMNDDINKINSAYTLLKIYNKDYPAGEFSELVKKRIAYLENSYQDGILFGSLVDEYNSERTIVNRKLKFALNLLTFDPPHPLSFIYKTEQKQSGVDITGKYFDDIIINNPQFKVFGYYYKILSLFGNFRGSEIIKPGLFDLKNQIFFSSEKGIDTKMEIDKLLNEMSDQFPSHPLTLDLHLICAKEFMSNNYNRSDTETLKHLQFILDNEEDKLSNRYLLVKEYVLNNTFRTIK